MTFRIIGYAIVSDDGMLADADGIIPPALIVKADQEFFMRGLDAAAAVIHGRNSAEQPSAPERRRLVITRHVAATASLPGNANGRLWNPAGASLADALKALDVSEGDIAVIGGTDIFGLFLPDYDAFYLSRVAGTSFPGGRPVFPQVPSLSPETILTKAGLQPGPSKTLDGSAHASVVTWTRR